MSTIEQSIEVAVPVRTAYDQWTQFEDFPRFMEGVETVRQLDDKRLHWVAEIGGRRREWDAEITEQRPDERVAWTNVDGARNAGVVTFHRIGDGVTRVMLQMQFEPEGMVEKAGDALGVVRRRVKGDLERFKGLHRGARPSHRGVARRDRPGSHPLSAARPSLPPLGRAPQPSHDGPAPSLAARPCSSAEAGSTPGTTPPTAGHLARAARYACSGAGDPT
jgi:hypothetical protein